MIQIDSRSPVPLNEQIKAGLRGLIARGTLRPGDPAPSVRSMAESLKVNPNTVARAVRELVVEGVLDARRGEGTFVADGAPRRAKDSLDDVRDRLREGLRQARRGGLSWNDVEAAVREARREEP
jgi:GntR family transcriptional regulator